MKMSIGYIARYLEDHKEEIEELKRKMRTGELKYIPSWKVGVEK